MAHNNKEIKNKDDIIRALSAIERKIADLSSEVMIIKSGIENLEVKEE